MTSGTGLASKYVVMQNNRSLWEVVEMPERGTMGMLLRRAHPFTEAEAKIIVFALNAVANGRHLARSTEIELNGGFDRWDFYDGPTDGVAPE